MAELDTRELVDALVRACQEDPEFRRRSRWVDSTVRLGIGDEGFVLRFAAGELIGAAEDDPTVRWDYEIVGPREDWERMWAGKMDLTQALVPQFGATQIRGDRVLYGAQAEMAVQLTRLLPRAAASLGLAVESDGPEPPDADPVETWKTSHEVVGRYVTVNGIRTYYESQGTDRSVAFIAVHTAGRDCRQWQRMGDVLADAGRFVALDLPGHSKSWPAPTDDGCLMSMDAISEFVWAFRDAVGIDVPTVVLGCSVGGNLVFQLGADYPDDVAGIVSMQGADHTPTQPESTRALMGHPQINPAFHHRDRTLALTGYRTPVPVREYLVWEARNYSSMSIYADLTAYTNFDYRERVPKIACPTLLIRGADDWIVSEDMVNGTASRLTGTDAVRVEMPPGVGHFSHVEQPQEFGDMVLDFFREHGIIES